MPAIIQKTARVNFAALLYYLCFLSAKTPAPPELVSIAIRPPIPAILPVATVAATAVFEPAEVPPLDDELPELPLDLDLSVSLDFLSVSLDFLSVSLVFDGVSFVSISVPLTLISVSVSLFLLGTSLVSALMSVSLSVSVRVSIEVWGALGTSLVSTSADVLTADIAIIHVMHAAIAKSFLLMFVFFLSFLSNKLVLSLLRIEAGTFLPAEYYSI